MIKELYPDNYAAYEDLKYERQAKEASYLSEKKDSLAMALRNNKWKPP